MADVPQLPSSQYEESDDAPVEGTGFYQILVLFIVFAILMALIVVGSNGGAA